MVIVSLLSWWYGAGLRHQLRVAYGWFDTILDYFSITLLLKSLFAPFRQISAGRVDGPLGVQMRAFFDRLISRCIGATVRAIIIFFGLIAIIVCAIGAIASLVAWLLAPLVPLAGLILTMMGWLPWM